VISGFPACTSAEIAPSTSHPTARFNRAETSSGHPRREVDLALHSPRTSGVFRAAGPEPGPWGGGRPTFLCPVGVEDGHDAEMVTYTDEHPPTTRYRHQLIAPPRAGVCCVSAMEWLDAPQRDVRGVYQDRCCRRCGFTVRVILRELRDAALIARRCVG